MKKEMRGATGETTAPATSAVGAVAPNGSKKVYTDAEKNACSIEAMRNGGTCEACQ